MDGAALERAWAWLSQGQSPFLLDVAVPLAVVASCYFGFGLLFYALDRSELRWWHGVKCQPGKVLTPSQTREIVVAVSTQMFTLYPLALWVASPLMQARLSYGERLPDAMTAVGHLAFFTLVTEVYFFHVHWALHHPKLYPWIHKVHHRYTAPIAFECLYFHPVESVLQLGTVVIAPMLLRSHVTLVYLWIVVTMFNISLHHSGHEVPYDELGFGSMAHQHDYHHLAFSYNFGVIGVCDWLYGTSGGYAEHHRRWAEQSAQDRVKKVLTVRAAAGKPTPAPGARAQAPDAVKGS